MDRTPRLGDDVWNEPGSWKPFQGRNPGRPGWKRERFSVSKPVEDPFDTERISDTKTCCIEAPMKRREPRTSARDLPFPTMAEQWKHAMRYRRFTSYAWSAFIACFGAILVVSNIRRPPPPSSEDVSPDGEPSVPKDLEEMRAWTGAVRNDAKSAMLVASRFVSGRTPLEGEPTRPPFADEKRKEVSIRWKKGSLVGRLNWPPPESVIQAHPGLREDLEKIKHQDTIPHESPSNSGVLASPERTGIDKVMDKPSKSALMRFRKKELQEALSRLGMDESGLKEELALRLIGTASYYHRVMSKPPFRWQEAADILVRARCSDVCMIDVQGLCSFTQHMVLGTARSTQHVYAAAGAVAHVLKSRRTTWQDSGDGPLVDGKNGSDWILVDTGEVIVHVFMREARLHYNLEGLWGRKGGENISFVQQSQTAETATV